MTDEFWFFIRWRADLVWGVKNGKAIFCKQSSTDYDSQLWAYRGCYLINKATNLVRAVEGMCFGPPRQLSRCVSARACIHIIQLFAGDQASNARPALVQKVDG